MFAALQPSDIFRFFEEVFKQARELEAAFTSGEKLRRVPFVTVSGMIMCVEVSTDILTPLLGVS